MVMKFSLMCLTPEIETQFDQQTPDEKEIEARQIFTALKLSKMDIKQSDLIGCMPMRRLVLHTAAKTAWAVVLVTPDLEEGDGLIRKTLMEYLQDKFNSEEIFIEEREREGLHYLYLIGKFSYLFPGQMGVIINDFIKNSQCKR